MPAPVRVLFAGESWMTHSVHTKGFDSFDMSSYHEGGTEMIAALRAGGAELTYQPSHIAMESFPFSRKEIDAFDVVILSDIGAKLAFASRPRCDPIRELTQPVAAHS
jgi:uncharacterized membrane protein